MQRKCLDLENEIRGLLKVFGVKLPIRLRGGAFEVAVRDTDRKRSSAQSCASADARRQADALRDFP